MKIAACLALFALLAGCIPIGVRGTTNVDAGSAPTAAGDVAPARSPAPTRA